MVEFDGEITHVAEDYPYYKDGDGAIYVISKLHGPCEGYLAVLVFDPPGIGRPGLIFQEGKTRNEAIGYLEPAKNFTLKVRTKGANDDGV